MSDAACGYERRLEEEHLAGKISLFADVEQRQREADLADRVHRGGMELGGRASRQEIEHLLSPAHFGAYRSSEYAKAVRHLVRDGRIGRRDAVGIRDKEPLRFAEPAQVSLGLEGSGPSVQAG